MSDTVNVAAVPEPVPEPVSQPVSPPDEVARQIAELDAIRRRVLNVVGHALRTPMATLRGLVAVLDNDHDLQTREQVIPALVRTTSRLERLLDDVLVASDVTTRLPTATPQDVRVIDTVRQVWRELAAPGDLLIEGDTDTRARVGTDGLRWMLWHLLDNAVKYGEGVVDVDLRTEDGDAVATISSSGPVLNSDDLARAFELFYRGEAAVISASSGMGVGLPVTKRLAEHAGGTVALRDREGGGVSAELRLPAATGTAP